jgi:histone H3/H4
MKKSYMKKQRRPQRKNKKMGKNSLSPRVIRKACHSIWTRFNAKAKQELNVVFCDVNVNINTGTGASVVAVGNE